MREVLGDGYFGVARRRLFNVYSRIPRIYWSQTGEDILLLPWLSEGEGRYVDVGAGHPRLASNTFGLYKRGWRGVLVEPNPQSARYLAQVRKGDQVVVAAIGLENGKTTLHVFDQDFYSSISSQQVAKLCDSGLRPNQEIEVEIVPLSSLGLVANPFEPTLLSVDCEGTDLEVLCSNDWDTYRPRVVLVEESFRTIEDPTPIRQFLNEQGYALLGHTGATAMYVSSIFIDGEPV